MVTVPRAWPGATVVVLATGPSLTRDDVDYCRGKARILAVNDAYTLAPWADALYGTDARWWHWHQGVPSFAGPKWSLEHSAWRPYSVRYPDVQRLRNAGTDGLAHEPTAITNGRNSGYAALNVAVHYGATKLLLLGYDMHTAGGRSHFFGEHPNKQKTAYGGFRHHFLTLRDPLATLGIAVVNCTPRSALTAFPLGVLRDVLPASSEVAA